VEFVGLDILAHLPVEFTVRHSSVLLFDEIC